MKKNVCVLIGSNRKESFNKRLARAVFKIAPETLNMQVVDIEQLPFFSQDLEENPPVQWVEYREKIAACDAVLIFTPEYNRSFTPLIKNALDIGLRPYGKGVLQNKPSAIVSASPGSLGGASANQHLQIVSNCIGMISMGSPEMYMSKVHTMLNDKDEFIEEKNILYMKKFLDKFYEWVNKFN